MLKVIKCSNFNYQKKLNDYIVSGKLGGNDSASTIKDLTTNKVLR